MRTGSSTDPQNAQALQLIWMAFLVSPVVMGVVAWIVLDSSRESGRDFSFSDPLTLTLCLVALGFFAVAGRISPRARLRSMQADEGSSESDRRLFPLLVIRWALFEAISVLGLALAVLTTSFTAILPFLFLALAGLLISSPARLLTVGEKGKLQRDLSQESDL